jgi:membrane-anchored protein YejM (alkaline phosphatase superfamily)
MAFCSILGHFRIVDILYIPSIQPLSNINLSRYLSIWCYIRGYYFTIVFIILESFTFNIFILNLSRIIYNFIISYSPPSTLARDCLANNTFSLAN